MWHFFILFLRQLACQYSSNQGFLRLFSGVSDIMYSSKPGMCSDCNSTVMAPSATSSSDSTNFCCLPQPSLAIQWNEICKRLLAFNKPLRTPQSHDDIFLQTPCVRFSNLLSVFSLAPLFFQPCGRALMKETLLAQEKLFCISSHYVAHVCVWEICKLTPNLFWWSVLYFAFCWREPEKNLFCVLLAN